MTPAEAESSPGLDRWCEALDWYATLRAADAKELMQAVGRNWRQWYAIPENRRVFDAVSRLMAAGPLYRRGRRQGLARHTDDRYDLSLSIAEWRLAEAERVKSRRPRRLRAWWRTPGGFGLGAIALLLILWSVRFQAGNGRTRPVIYETGVGGTKEVDLSDGSRLVLGQLTRLKVAYSTQQRSVSLIRGQAWFKVVHDEHWPFIVSAGDGRITDAGTAFLVTRESGRVLVAVADGRVEVSARPLTWRPLRGGSGVTARPALARVAVTGGEQLFIADNGVLGRPTRMDTYATDECACAALTFDNESLRDVVREITPESSKSILVDPSAGGLRVSGVVFPNEISQWLRSLQRILPVEVLERGRHVRIRFRHSKSPIHGQARAGRP